MSSPSPPPNPSPAPTATSRGAQVALGVFLAVLIALVAFRGYSNRLGARPTEPVATDLVDLNTADEKEIGQVPGVGPKLAQAIVDHRRVNGPFRSVDELHDVRGVGPVTFDKIRSHFRVAKASHAEGWRATDQFQPPPGEVLPSPSPIPVPRPPERGSKKIQPGEAPINVNTAGADELQRLPGIGPVTARAIIATRPFESVEDLDNVKGIGPKTLEKLRPFVVVK